MGTRERTLLKKSAAREATGLVMQARAMNTREIYCELKPSTKVS